MKERFLIRVFVALLASATVVWWLVGWLLPSVKSSYVQSAVAQRPKRWVAGDTLWMEIDSIPALPSDAMLLRDSMVVAFPELDIDVVYPDSLLRNGLPEHIQLDYHIPYWSVYRRSVTLWGITFSTGQANPYSPFPAEAKQDATVLSFPIRPPH